MPVYLGNSIKSEPLHLDPLTGRVAPAWMVAAVDELLVKVRHMDVWKIVDFCIEIWAKKYPTDHKKYLDEMKKYRANRKNKYSSTKTMWLRELVIAPQELTYLLNKVASHRIEEYGTAKFWRDFSRKYPGFRPGEKF